MSSTKQTIAFFGATGGVTAAALAHALKAKHHCTALARTPNKLHELLTSEHSIPATTIQKCLTVVQGDAKKPDDVAKVLISPVDNKYLVDIILTAIGTYPVFSWSIRRPLRLPDPTICEDGMAANFAAIDELANQNVLTTTDRAKPLLIMISSTAGPDRRNHNLPWLFAPLYWWLLVEPHNDKLNMEKLALDDNGAHVRESVIIRPSILTDGPENGLESVKVGWIWNVDTKVDRPKAPGHVTAWGISRKNVGAWVFKKVIVEGGWEGRSVSLRH
ncbi:hypothetical protein K491DRAFT_778085 [Lophiostoma macrostomum CBS 122681]|uniref:NAD(P)-binding domain-containing protein n=1 Tax=Lophiostoma macrostomum CBS 122681 TaxID=1314788 RepID=A0A6A6TCE0_9PLEO|nr:hypothetical protein K491DRAFT_778085 [Lophiostoma macrostomum CBS 122681]